nr:YdcF family protein [Rhodobium orientis]
MLFVPLESRFPRVTEVVTPPTGIVVLGGAVDTVRTERHGQVALAESAERVTAAAALARRFPEARIVLSGGQVAIFPGTVQEADAMVTLMASLGVHSRRPVLEDRSQNTWQNAVYSLDLAKPQPGERWLLVTSAFHMPRAIGVFRKAGWTGITAYPVDYRSTSDHLGFTSVSRGLRFTDIAVREWIGLVAYYLTGRTDSLLPGPDGVRK